ncbi:MAG: ribosome maturation factor RimP [Coriobacteriales bacterium]|jgi:ribosome maturation factor RimP|nr:ribosome maturation factor RimP [Coriobacteriales bacterium]
MRTKKEQALLEILESVAAAHGFELVDLQISGAQGARVVRVFLDRAPEAGGLGIDALAEANAWVGPVVEELDPVSGRYTLEVSSPGIDRPLRTTAHFARFVGETVHLATESFEGRRSWTGELVGLEDVPVRPAGAEDAREGEALILLNIAGTVHRIPYGKIRKAHVKGRVDFKERDQDVI